MKEHLSLLCDRYYEALDVSTRMAFIPGQIYYAPILYPVKDIPYILKVDDYDPKGAKPTTFKIESFIKTKKGDYEHPPIKELPLASDEFLFVQKGKMRACICLADIEVDWAYRQKICLVAPIFGFNLRTEEIKNRVIGYQYPNLFFLPANPKMGLDKDSAVRLELIQPVLKGGMQPFGAAIDKKPVQLSRDAYYLLLNHLTKFISGKPFDEEIEKDVQDFQTIIKGAIGE
jgi:hypothetical protein